MNNASLIFDSLESFPSVRGLIGKQEDIFLDFKESASTSGAMLDDDKAHFSKAASGFAHQEGGVLVWGVEARKGSTGVDEATALKPIPNIGRFVSELNDYVKYSTEPVVDGILNRVIYEQDDEKSGRGYAISFFPKSNSEHRALWKHSSGFYKRHGDSFSPLSTSDIRALFFRNFAPELELQVARQPNGTLRFSLYNKGRGVAKFAAADIGLSPNPGGMWHDGEGDNAWKVGSLVYTRREPYTLQFFTSPNVVVHPGQEVGILTGPTFAGQQSPGSGRQYTSKIAYRLFAENMLPKEGTVNL